MKSLSKVACFGLSDVGLVREHNEDAWRALPEAGLFMVADGMGGHKGGEVAAHEVVKWLSQWAPSLDKRGLGLLIEEANGKVYQLGQKRPELAGMGTTVCALYLHQDEAVIGHVGDSRAYLLRKKKLELLTSDHSLVNDLLSVGAMKPEDASTFPYRHILTRAIGTQGSVKPTIKSLPTEERDLFLLCSDGLTNYVSDEEIQKILTQDDPIERRGYLLVDLAKKHGGGDNVTVLLVNLP